MADRQTEVDWDRVSSRWARLGEVVMGYRDRFDAQRRLIDELGFSETDAETVLDLSIGDLVQLARLSPGRDLASSAEHAEWQARGRAFSSGSFPTDERTPWNDWIVDGVESGWLNVIRLQEPGSLAGMERTNDDRSVYIEHAAGDGPPVRVHTAIGGSFPSSDETLAIELGERIAVAAGDPLQATIEAAMQNGEWGLCAATLEGVGVTGRSLRLGDWWGVAVAVDVDCNVFVTGHGAELPELDLVIVQSFADLDPSG